jgi:hypothetical protein
MKRITILFLVLLTGITVFSQNVHNYAYGELVSEMKGVDLYFRPPQIKGSAAGTYAFVNTTGRNLTINYLKWGTEQKVHLDGGSDGVRYMEAPRGEVSFVDVTFP